jgi:murein DD-endopeptidase MepM/ murein hydrolase activator NlpD
MLIVAFSLWSPSLRPLPPAPSANASADAGSQDGKTDRQWIEVEIQPGDTMQSIALQYNFTVEDLARANDMGARSRLESGQILLVPRFDDSVEATRLEVVRRWRAESGVDSQPPRVLVWDRYKVQPGDSVWSISNLFGIAPDTLVGCNSGLSVLKRPRPGQLIRIPNQDGILYRVRPHETPRGIAERNAIPIDRLVFVNGPNTERIAEGNFLFLPGAQLPDNPLRDGRSLAMRRAWRWPLDGGRLTSRFGLRRDPFSGWMAFHAGIDLGASYGTTIRASRKGIVSYAGWLGGYGRAVILLHDDGCWSLYGHCSGIGVSEGQSVDSGQAIASVGSTGRSTGPHLHFEVRRNNSPVNPLDLLPKR